MSRPTLCPFSDVGVDLRGLYLAGVRATAAGRTKENVITTDCHSQGSGRMSRRPVSGLKRHRQETLAHRMTSAQRSK